MLFLNLIDLFKIVLGSLKYQLLLELYVSVEKKFKMFHSVPFFYTRIHAFAKKSYGVVGLCIYTYRNASYFCL